MQQRALTHNPRPLKTLFDLEIQKRKKKEKKKKRKKEKKKKRKKIKNFCECFDAS